MEVSHRDPWRLGNHEDGLLSGVDRLVQAWEATAELLGDEVKQARRRLRDAAGGAEVRTAARSLWQLLKERGIIWQELVTNTARGKPGPAPRQPEARNSPHMRDQETDELLTIETTLKVVEKNISGNCTRPMTTTT